MSEDHDAHFQHVPFRLGARRVRVNDDVLFQEVGGEAVLLNLGTESYFGLNDVGTRIWILLSEGNSLQDVCNKLCWEFDVTPEQLQSDLSSLIDEMLKAGLIQMLDARKSNKLELIYQS